MREKIAIKFRNIKPLGILAISLTMLFWYSLSVDGFGVIDAIKFPPPSQVFAAIDVLGVKIATDMVSTLGRVLFGLIVGTILGSFVGALIVFSKRVGEFLHPLIESARPVPIIAMIPFFLMWFGIEEPGKLILVTLGVFMLIVVNVVESIKNVPRIYINAARTLGASKSQIQRKIILPSIIPNMIGPLRVAVALTFTLVVAAEFMGAQSGIGYRILEARRLFNPQVILLGIFQLGILAAFMDAILQQFMGRLTKWTGR
jgi:ABC-type nitrate/sulfonate/bicarbonate transport system permease component